MLSTSVTNKMQELSLMGCPIHTAQWSRRRRDNKCNVSEKRTTDSFLLHSCYKTPDFPGVLPDFPPNLATLAPTPMTVTSHTQSLGWDFTKMADGGLLAQSQSLDSWTHVHLKSDEGPWMGVSVQCFDFRLLAGPRCYHTVLLPGLLMPKVQSPQCVGLCTGCPLTFVGVRVKLFPSLLLACWGTLEGVLAS